MEKIVCDLLCSTEADALCKISFVNLIRISVKSGDNFSNISECLQKLKLFFYLTVSFVLFQFIKLCVVYYVIYKPMCYVRLVLRIRAKTLQLKN